MSLIAPQTLYGECDAFLAAFAPFGNLWAIEAQYGLPRGFLLAVVTRETNGSISWLENPHQPGNGGSGAWQQTSPRAPTNFPPLLQAQTAAIRLQECLQATKGNVDEAADIYNSGRPLDADTTGGDYGPDVAARRILIALRYPPPPPPLPPEEGTMNCLDPNTNGTWIVDPVDGHVECWNGAPYLGALNDPPNADGWTEVGTIAGITPYMDPQGKWGYQIIVRHFTKLPDGAWFSPYSFPRDGSKVGVG